MHGNDTDLSTHAESVVAAAAVLVGGFWEAVLRLPEPEDFDDPDLSELWTGILEARKRGVVTKTAVQQQMRELGWGDAKAFKALKAQPSYVTLPEALSAVDELLTRRLRRQAMRVCGETLKELATTVDVAGVVQRHEIRIIDVASRGDGAADSWQAGTEVSEERLERVETGIADFDRVNGGLASGVLTIAAARPGMGKSAFAVAVMRNIAKRGLGVGCNSLEMPSLDLIHRAAAAEAYDFRLRVPGEPEDLSNPRYSDYERRLLHGYMLERFETAKAAIKRLPIRWDEKQGRTIGQIRMGGRRLRTVFGREAIDLRLLVIDHLGKIKGEGKQTNRHLELGEISDGLMQLAAELRIPVLALCQLSRDVEKRPDKRPQISDLRESGRLEEDAHTVLLLYRQAYYDSLAKERGEEIDADEAERNANVMEVNTVKFRGGQLRQTRLFCDIGANAIMGLSEASQHMRRARQSEMFG